MFSSRFPVDLAPNRLTRQLEAYQATDRPLLDLTASNPTRAAFDYPRTSILEALSRPGCLEYAADPRGVPSARTAVAGYYRDREGLLVPIDRIFLTASTSEAYTFLLKLLCDPGEAVLVPSPSYPLFDCLLGLEGVRPVPYPLRYDGRWHIDPGAIEPLISRGVRAIVSVNPNNPTGAYLQRDELDHLVALCRAHDLALISDEVFADYAWEPDPSRVETVAAQGEVLSFSLSGLSKVLGLPQMKLGWILVNGPEPRLGEALARLEYITDTFLSVGTPIQEALPALLAMRETMQGQIRARVERNRRAVLEQIAEEPGITPLRAEGGWSLVLRVPRVKGEEAMVIELLETDGVLVHPGFFFDFPSEAFLVVSLLTRPEVLDEGLARLVARVRAWVGE